MKFFIVFSFVSSLIVGAGLYASDEENLKKQIELMKQKIEQLEKEKKKPSGGGLKVKDYDNSSMGVSNTSSSSTNNSNNQQITPEQMKLLQDSMKKGKKYLEERNEYLKELENED
ncbi:MAG: hypothetical protein KC493_02460 [Bacteriovoracaceae bacterium]|nr:hypothetical protein [Bacteriovoracaceae bacterium]